MSVQFGQWNIDGAPVDRAYLEQVKGIVSPYGPDETNSYLRENIGMGYCAFHTTLESRREIQPYLAPSGAAITWDGRLDNRSELIDALGDVVTPNATDLEIVAAAFMRWGKCCFGKLLGDWALVVWNPASRTLLLAKDVIGIRHLYYSITNDHVVWSSLLEPLIQLREDALQLEEEYIAGWFSFFPAADLTPYSGIHSVPPSSFAVIQPGKCRVTKYWDFDPAKRIRHRSDEEYEEHFRTVFQQAVERRLRADRPIVAELSGGMDSSSIVCMADKVVANRSGLWQRIDTMSIYDDTDPNWDERPYFVKVEEQRGRTGYHIDASRPDPQRFELSDDRFGATPGSGSTLPESAQNYAAWMRSEDRRVVLSGTGGDEVCGGVPTPVPELANLLISAQWRSLARQLKAYAIDKRVPWLDLLSITLRCFLSPSLRGVQDFAKPLPWLDAGFVARNLNSLRGYPRRLRVFGALPSFQTSYHALNTLRRQLSCANLRKESLFEYRYPYLDRDLLEFSLAIPREQWVRPGQRRSLMRRSLVGIVPSELLNRKRKGYVSASAFTNAAANLRTSIALSGVMAVQSFGFADAVKFSQVLEDAMAGREVHIVGITRTLCLERWLRTGRDLDLLAAKHDPCSPTSGKEMSTLQTNSC